VAPESLFINQRDIRHVRVCQQKTLYLIVNGAQCQKSIPSIRSISKG